MYVRLFTCCKLTNAVKATNFLKGKNFSPEEIALAEEKLQESYLITDNTMYKLLRADVSNWNASLFDLPLFVFRQKKTIDLVIEQSVVK